MKIHEAANIFPMMGKDDFNRLKEDIKENGLLEAIRTCEGKIIDGRNRAKVCEQLKIEPKYEEFIPNGITPLDFVISQNLTRRHLNKGQIACIAAEAAQERIKENLQMRNKHGVNYVHHVQKGKSCEIFAKKFDVSTGRVSYASSLLHKNPKLFEEAKSGLITLENAYKLLPNDGERKVKKFSIPQESILNLQMKGWNWEAYSEETNGERTFCYHFYRKGIPKVKDWSEEPCYKEQRWAIRSAAKEALEKWNKLNK